MDDTTCSVFRTESTALIQRRLGNFYESANKRLIDGRDGQLVPPTIGAQCFPEVLIWFYSVERLRIVKEGEGGEDDWSLPKLLWE